MRAVADGDIEVIDMWEEGDGPQDNTFVTVPISIVLYIDATFIKHGIPIRPMNSELQLSL